MIASILLAIISKGLISKFIVMVKVIAFGTNEDKIKVNCFFKYTKKASEKTYFRNWLLTENQNAKENEVVLCW